MSSKKFILGGDINKSLSEGYRFDLKKLFKDGVNITRKNFLPLLTACMFILLSLSALFSLVIDETFTLDDPSVILIYFLLALLVAPPLMTGLMMMGIHHAVGLKTKSLDLFNYFNIVIKLSLAAMMINLMTNVASMLLEQALGNLGFSVSILVLLYLKMCFCLVYPLIAEKKISPILALKISFKLVNKNLGQFTQLLMIFCFLLFIGLLSYGIAFLFIIPFYINVMGIIYRQVCGIGIAVIEKDENDDSTNGGSGTQNGEFEA